MQENESFSKREQRKLAQTIRLINSLEAKEPRNIEEGSVEPKPRKKRKTSTKISIFNAQIQLKTLKADDQEQAAETKSACNLTPQHEKSQTSKEKPVVQNSDPEPIDHLNPAFPLEGGDISSFLICYQYSQQQKQLDKQESDSSQLDQLGEPLATSSHQQSLKVVQKLMAVLSECKQVVGGCPFSKQHLAFTCQWR